MHRCIPPFATPLGPSPSPPAVFYFSMGSAFLPGHPAWATLLLWATAQVGAGVAWQLRLPRVVGMLCAGLLMRNIPWSAVDAFPEKWGVQMRAAALATIFLRWAGCEGGGCCGRRWRRRGIRGGSGGDGLTRRRGGTSNGAPR